MAVKIDWDASRYADRVPNTAQSPTTKAGKERERSIKAQYPPLQKLSISTPCIIHDMQGIILTWYLPGILNDSRQASPFILSDRRGGPDKF